MIKKNSESSEKGMNKQITKYSIIYVAILVIFTTMVLVVTDKVDYHIRVIFNISASIYLLGIVFDMLSNFIDVENMVNYIRCIDEIRNRYEISEKKE